jgi:biopolymer transport protein ExbD
MPLGTLVGAMKVEAERYTNTADQPVIQIDTDKDAQYNTLATVLADAKNAGLIKIGFVDSGQR